MAEYDAFGRKVGEDTLAEAGWRDAERARAASSAAPSDEPFEAAPGPDRPQFVRPRRTSRIVVLFVLAMLGIGAAVVFSAMSALTDAIDESVDGLTVPTITPPESVPVEPVPGEPAGGGASEPATGLGEGSLLRPERFGAALDELGHPGGEMLTLRLAPDRIDAQLHVDSRTWIVQIGSDGRLRTLATAPGSAGRSGFRAGDLDPRSPRRLLLGAERRFGLAPDRVDYLVALSFDGEMSWNAYYRGGGHVQAGPDGRVTRRMS